MDVSVDQSPPPAKRSRNAKRSSLACVSCKRMKRRCDISQQEPDSRSCTNCRNRGAYCEVRHGEDRRRKRPVQSGLDIESRLSVLEDMIVQSDFDRRMSRSNGVEDQDQNSTATYTSATQRTDIAPGSTGDAPATPASYTAQQSIPQPTASEGLRPQIGATGPVPAAETTMPPNLSLRRAEQQQPGNSPDGASTVSNIPSVATQVDDSGGIIERVVSRSGALEGQSPDNVRYFGPTSMYHLSSTYGGRDMNDEGFKTSNDSTPNPWAQISPEHDPSNEPEALVLCLIDLFCDWQASHLQIFHRKLFLQEKKLFDNDRPRGRYEFFSPSLLYAIMALASMVSLDRGTRYQSAIPGQPPGSIYFDKAKALFQLEMENPSITTVQTALLLGSHYGASGHQSPGWTYSGIALRMAVDLGLHISCDAAVVHKQLSPQVARLRKIVFWGCYVQDKLWSAYCGRPSFIMDWDITVSRPEKPSGLGGHGSEKEAIQNTVHWNIVLLSVQISKILGELYSQKHSGNQRRLGDAAAAIHSDLLKWHDQLPDTLKWPNESGSPSSPHVLLMHMQFYFTLLLLHRPFIDFSQHVAGVHSLDGISPSAASICNLAATNITKLSRDYSLSYNLRQVPSPAIHFIFIAATIHLINHRVAGDGSDELLFQGCLSSLAETGQSYPAGRKAVSVLQELVYSLKLSRILHASSTRSGEAEPRSAGPDSGSRDSPTQAEAQLSRSQMEATVANRPHTFTACDTVELGQSTGEATIGNAGQSQDVDLLHWAADQGGFDWSNLNSPIMFPPDLDHVDLNPRDEVGQHIPSEAHQFLDLWPSVADQGFDNTGDYHMQTNEVVEAGSRAETSMAFLERYYGTAFGLQRNS
ncbi:hypothetical protein G7046_g1860 [Stylonectria norvegica]|nr:hypothetical protein G7046_g1860 [Stylonectria norvegica]